VETDALELAFSLLEEVDERKMIGELFDGGFRNIAKFVVKGWLRCRG